MQVSLTNQYSDTANGCQFCEFYGYTTTCGGQICGTQYGCSGDTMTNTQCYDSTYNTYTLIYACVFIYAGYEVLILVGLMCLASALRPSHTVNEVVIVDHHTALNNYSNYPPNNSPPNYPTNNFPNFGNQGYNQDYNAKLPNYDGEQPVVGQPINRQYYQ